MEIVRLSYVRLVLCISDERLERKYDVVISVVARIEKSRADVMCLWLIRHNGLSSAA